MTSPYADLGRLLRRAREARNLSRDRETLRGDTPSRRHIP